MTVTITKMTFQKLKPRIINYRGYTFFDNARHRNDLLHEIPSSYLEFSDNGFSGFFDICRTTLDQHAPRKRKYARGNHMPFINKTLSKEIMKRNKLQNKFLKDGTEENRNRYASQRNCCVSLLEKTKKENFGDLNQKNVSDNKKFWKTVKPFLSDKIISTEQITLVENNEIISEDSDVAQTLNYFFSNIVTNLKTPAYADSNSNLENVSDPIIKLILNYTDHSSILTIGEVCKEKSDSPFLFTGIGKEEILKEIENLDASKACQDTDVPTKILKENTDIFSDFLHASFNEFVKKSSRVSVSFKASSHNTSIQERGKRM